MPYILVLMLSGGLGTSASPTILRFASYVDCVNTAPVIAESIKRQMDRTGVFTARPAISYECVQDLSNPPTPR